MFKKKRPLLLVLFHINCESMLTEEIADAIGGRHNDINKKGNQISIYLFRSISDFQQLFSLHACSWLLVRLFQYWSIVIYFLCFSYMYWYESEKWFVIHSGAWWNSITFLYIDLCTHQDASLTLDLHLDDILSSICVLYCCCLLPLNFDIFFSLLFPWFSLTHFRTTKRNRIVDASV